jgi:hypothetical protein
MGLYICIYAKKAYTICCPSFMLFMPLFYVFLLGVGEDTFDRDDVRQSQLATVNIHNLCVTPNTKFQLNS